MILYLINKKEIIMHKIIKTNFIEFDLEDKINNDNIEYDKSTLEDSLLFSHYIFGKKFTFKNDELSLKDFLSKDKHFDKASLEDILINNKNFSINFEKILNKIIKKIKTELKTLNIYYRENLKNYKDKNDVYISLEGKNNSIYLDFYFYKDKDNSFYFEIKTPIVISDGEKITDIDKKVPNSFNLNDLLNMVKMYNEKI
jgi:hypothetical protein